MPRALCSLRDSLNYRKEAFERGLQAAGYKLVPRLDRPEPGDVLLTWNRTGAGAEMAAHVERHGGRVLVAENGWLGKTWRGGKWFTLALGHNAGAGNWPDGGPSRWDSWSVDLAPWKDGGDVIVFEQRGIGEPGHGSPPGWHERAARMTGGRVRKHPGATLPAVTLADDLANARCAVTWNSAAAMQAMAMGTAVYHDHPLWMGRDAAAPLSTWGAEPVRDDQRRLAMFRWAAWSLWTVEEVMSGAAFAHLLASA